MTNGHYIKKRFKCRCYEKDSSVKIYDNSETILDISYRDFDDAFYCSRKLKSVIDKLNTLVEENEQLKQRNDRQAKRLDNLYTLIEKEDWKTLTGLIQEFQECEEQLQREWRTYE